MRILRNCRLLSSLFNKNKLVNEDKTDLTISASFDLGEKISRSIFSPINIKKDNSLRNNSFTTPAGIDEVSVNRLNYTSSHFIKKISKKISNPNEDRNYCGVAIIDVKEIHESESEIHYTPNKIELPSETIDNPFHSDIKIGFVKEFGKPLPVEFSYKVDLMVGKARFYLDDNPDSENWEGVDLI
jgi:hypothetical protein